jgi:hypothetical protein
VLTFTAGATSVEFVFDALSTVKEKSTLVEVVTPLRVYEDMILISMEVPRSAKEGDGMRASLSFKHMRRVRSKLVAAPAVSIKRATKPQPKGKQDAPAVVQPKQSVGAWAADQIGKAIPGIKLGNLLGGS